VTLQVLKTLDDVKAKYAAAPQPIKDQCCSTSGLKNFDIHRLIDYGRWRDWPGPGGTICAPAGTPCQYTVQFFDRCYHAAVVNYTMWGVIETLCDLILPYHAIWNLWQYGGSPHYDEQQVMVAFGARYARMRGTAEEFIEYVQKHRDNLLAGLRPPTHPGYGGTCALCCGPDTVDPPGPWKWHWGPLSGGT
jgi:hypothetical protein